MDLHTHPDLVPAVKKTAIAINFLLDSPGAVPGLRIGSEFMPPLYEGTIFYMPVTKPRHFGDRGPAAACGPGPHPEKLSGSHTVYGKAAAPKPPPTRRPSA
jgi:hypothetical protein